jgi:hypothetical protein
MTGDRTRRDVVAAAGAAGLAATAGCVGTMFVKRKEKTVSGTIDPGDAAALATANDLGDLVVEAERRADVHYRAHMKSSISEKNFDELSVRDRHEGDTLHVDGVHEEDGTETERDPVLNLTLRVPASLPVTSVRGSYGEVRVDGTTGDVTARADAGDLTVRDVDGDVDADTSAGDLEVQAVEGDVTARADAGDLEVRDVSGFAGGDIEAGDAEFVDLGGLEDVSADAGDLTAEAPALRGDTRVQMDSGDLTLRLGDGLDAEVVATAESGDVTVDGLPLSVRESTVGGRAEGTLGDGTHRLRVVADSGDVDLEPL